jgi:hypothetical protein
MKILHSDTPHFYFDENKLEIIEEDYGVKKMMRIESLKVKNGFSEFMKEAEEKYDCLILLQNYKSFQSFPQPDGTEYCTIRYWGHYSQKFIDRVSIRDQDDYFIPTH